MEVGLHVACQEGSPGPWNLLGVWLSLVSVTALVEGDIYSVTPCPLIDRLPSLAPHRWLGALSQSLEPRFRILSGSPDLDALLSPCQPIEVRLCLLIDGPGRHDSPQGHLDSA